MPDAQKTDWEVELGVVIGRRTQYLPDPASARVRLQSHFGWFIEPEGNRVELGKPPQLVDAELGQIYPQKLA